MAKKDQETKDVHVKDLPLAERMKILGSTVATLNKKYGDGSVMKASDLDQEAARLPFGNVVFDNLTGGGIPRSRVTHVFGSPGVGKTTLMFDIIAGVQANGGIAALVDAEHSFDALSIGWAKSRGVNIDTLALAKPNNAEEALTAMLEFAKSGVVDVAVFDSVAALSPKQEEERDLEQDTMALIARLNSKFFRKFTAINAKNGMAAIFLNQTRTDIASYGCLHGETPIMFTDGSHHTIKEIVDNHIEGKVYSLDSAGNLVAAKIVEWFNNGKLDKETEEFITITTEGPDTSNGVASSTVTGDHLVLTTVGWKKAKDITTKDRAISKYTELVGYNFTSILFGTLIGDSNIFLNSIHSGLLRLQDNTNPEYMEWKAEKLSALGLRKKKCSRGSFYISEARTYLAQLKKKIGERDPLSVIDKMGFLGLAVWYMDDGSINLDNYHKRGSLSVKRFKGNAAKLDEICQAIAKEFGIFPTPSYKNGDILFNTAEFKKLCKGIRHFIPSCMQYKLPPEHRGFYTEIICTTTEIIKSIDVAVVSAQPSTPRKYRDRTKYDIGVEGYHNYLAGNVAGGFIVHNSPDTAPGGRAIKFYASLEIGLRRGAKAEWPENGYTIVAKVTKTKISGCQHEGSEARVNFMYGKGIDPQAALVVLAMEQGVIARKSETSPIYQLKVGDEVLEIKGKENVVPTILENNKAMAYLSKEMSKIIK